MAIFLLVVSTILLLLGHLFKVYRWEQFIEIYEKPKTKYLIQSLSLGYIINFLVPFRIGDICRIWYSGKKMKNGLAFSFATVVVDRVLDIISIALIFISLYLFGINDSIIKESVIFYLIISIVILLFFALALKFNKLIKNIIKKTARIFNSDIELKILKASWFGIISFKDIAKKINKNKMIFNTILMWTFYLCSYGLLAKSLNLFGFNFGFIEILNSLFSMSTLDISVGTLLKALNNSYIWIMATYITLPLILLIIISLFYKKGKNIKDENDKKYLQILPHVRTEDKLNFLEAYFSGQSREFFKIYLDLNDDISILQDFSAGSNATTLLCTNEGKTFFRKYAIGKDCDKLYEQVLWLQKNSKDLKLTEVLNVKYKKGYYCSYDMPYYSDAISCFNFVHSNPIDDGWKTIEKALEDLNKNLYSKNNKKADKEIVEKYIDSKVEKNLTKIENGHYIKPLLKYNKIKINGKSYYNLKHFKKYLTKEYLYEVFKNDNYCEIHGDLTIENIICQNKNYYIIDPNTGNLHDSPALDYSKLLQSLHGNYEFYMNTKMVEIDEDNINYISIKSFVYDELFKKYHNYLKQKFSREEVRSIFFHEIIHWLRLLPYKIEKNGDRSVLFYAGLIIVLNEVIEMYGD